MDITYIRINYQSLSNHPCLAQADTLTDREVRVIGGDNIVISLTQLICSTKSDYRALTRLRKNKHLARNQRDLRLIQLPVSS